MGDTESRPYVLMRQDDNGNRYVMDRFSGLAEAEAAAELFEAQTRPA
jgi:hypothetical protein